MIRRNQHITGSVGRMRDQVTIQVETATTDGMGGQSVTYSTFANVFALVEPLSVNERIEAESLIGQVSHKVTLRYLDMKNSAQYRLQWRGKNLTIKSVIDMGNIGRFTMLMCSEAQMGV